MNTNCGLPAFVPGVIFLITRLSAVVVREPTVIFAFLARRTYYCRRPARWSMTCMSLFVRSQIFCNNGFFSTPDPLIRFTRILLIVAYAFSILLPFCLTILLYPHYTLSGIRESITSFYRFQVIAQAYAPQKRAASSTFPGRMYEIIEHP